jgi:hypothetical protein
MIQLSVTVLGAPVNGQHPTLVAAVPHHVQGHTVVINRVLLAQLANTNPQAVHGCSVSINCENALVRIEGVPFIAIARFVDEPTPRIAFLSVSGSSENCKLDGISVGRADIERSHAALIDSTVEHLNIGIRTAHEHVAAAGEDVRVRVAGSQVANLRIFVPTIEVECCRSAGAAWSQRSAEWRRSSPPGQR